ncbi:hypothetical protein L6164_001205 [Bauhinia variegata]|uniref:Uncharacterized protein n=1 Tax=Bauhinia variegata TaxID=167791 RepID=A0ACB9Q969_BAUVA|nr:hypothetical protein L6164_001205 [Bauhinia variegata]
MLTTMESHGSSERGKVILESVILTTTIVISLTLYTFCASRKGHDFNFPWSFLVWCSISSYGLCCDSYFASTRFSYDECI